MENYKIKPLLESFSNLSPEDQKTLFAILNNMLEKDKGQEDIATVLEIRKKHQEKQRFCCPYCQSDQIIGHGSYKLTKRYKCKYCNRTFSDITGTAIAHIHRKDKWEAYIDCMLKGYSLRKTGNEVGICLKTAFDWRHKILKALKEIGCRKLEGIIEADETFFLYSEKGNKQITERKSRKRGGEESRDGIHKGHVAVFVSSDRDKNMIINVGCRGRITKRAIHNAIGKWIEAKNSILCTDSHLSYQAYAKDRNIEHKRIFIRKNQYVKDKIYHTQNVNNIHSRLKKWMLKFNGVATKYLQNYMDYFRLNELVKAESNQIESALKLILIRNNVYFTRENIKQQHCIT